MQNDSLFNVIQVDEIPTTFDEYNDGDLIIIGKGDNVISYYVYIDNNSRSKNAISISTDVVMSLNNAYEQKMSNINKLIKLAGRYSADDIIKFKTNGLF